MRFLLLVDLRCCVTVGHSFIIGCSYQNALCMKCRSKFILNQHPSQHVSSHRLLRRRVWQSVVLLCIALMLSSCRYWSLYRFADQFCAFDQHIEVGQRLDRTRLDFIDPVLPQTVFARYFKAIPVTHERSHYHILERYLFKSLTSVPESLSGTDKHFELSALYSATSDKPLLMAGELGPALSRLFPPMLVSPILRAACSDDLDLSLSLLELRMQLPAISTELRPSRAMIMETFGAPSLEETDKPGVTTLSYQFDFVLKQLNGNDHLQNKPIRLSLSFDEQQALQALRVNYLNYQLWLDFAQQRAELRVIRDRDDTRE